MAWEPERQAGPAVPRDEIAARAARLWSLAGERNLAAVFAVERVEVLYFSGTPQDGVVWLPRDGEPLFLVRRDLERARRESPLTRVLPFSRARDIPAILEREGVALEGPVATSLDVLPVNLFRSLGRALGVEIEDCSAEVRWTRAVKSPFERQRVRAAGALAQELFEALPRLIQPGMREADLAGEVDAFLLRSGSVSYYRTRTFNLEFTGLCCLAGASADWRSAADSPSAGGHGPDPAIGQGASSRPLRPDEPILIDLGTNRAGYYVDTSRVFHWGELPTRFREAQALSVAILDAAVADIERGLPLETVYANAVERAQAAGLGDAFMGGSRFLGHGVGLEIDEWPVVAEGFDQPLPEGAVVALEPKFALPGGIVGVETTFLFEGGRMQPLVDLPGGATRLASAPPPPRAHGAPGR
jgi:Xaa-Pro aminopeptidase